MRASHGSTRIVTLGLASLAVAVTYACTDTALGPGSRTNASTIIDVRGDANGSVWRVIDGELTYVGAATTHFDGRLSGAGFRPKAGSANALDLSPLEIEELRSRLSRNAISLTPPASPLVPSAASAPVRPAVLRRISFKTHFRRGLERDGVRTDWVPDPRGGKRPPVAMLIYKNGRATALIEPTYMQTATAWQPRRARTTLFDSTGAVSKIILSDFTSLESQIASAGFVDRFAAGALRAAAAFGTLFRPDVLHAATQPDDAEDITRCLPQATALALATATLALDLVALDAAITACGASVVACAALPLAYARVARSTAAELAAAAFLAACWSADDDCENTGGTLPETFVAGAHASTGQAAARSCTNGAGSYEICVDYQYEISFDGGATWTPLVERVCQAAQ